MKPNQPQGLKPQEEGGGVVLSVATEVATPPVSILPRWGRRLGGDLKAASFLAGALARAVLKALALGAIRFYQAALRPMNPWGCKYYPSCSNYALEAIELHGVARGAWLGARRLLRCHPLVFGGFDPVPEAESERVS